MQTDWKPRLIELIRQHALLLGEFTLRSGKKSTYYIDGRMITLHPEGALLIARGILTSIAGERVDAVGGPEMGAVPIVGAVCAVSHQVSRPVRGFVFRKEVKEHGTKKLIEGPIQPGDRVVVVEDTTTTAGQVVKCIRACKGMGCEVVKVIPVIDREDEGRANVEAEGCIFAPLVTIADLGLRG
jgi:orotate phosphoribosyltransferase